MRGQVGNRVQEIVGEEIVKGLPMEGIVGGEIVKGLPMEGIVGVETANPTEVEIAVTEEGAVIAVTKEVDIAKDLLAIEMKPVDDLATRRYLKQRPRVCFPLLRLILPRTYL